MPDLDDPEYSRFAWGRFRRLMGWMAAVAVAAVVVSLAALWYFTGPIPIHMLIATILGVGATVLLGTALMGLAFLSSGSGHDAKIDDRSRPEEDR